jgi:superoxide dismutase, Fe-Mn family
MKLPPAFDIVGRFGAIAAVVVLSPFILLLQPVAVDAKIELLELPYSHSALEPIISAETMKYHYDKHYVNYVTTTNTMIKDGLWDFVSLEEIMIDAYQTNETFVFQAAGQSWNHAFYWQSMKPPAVTPEEKEARSLTQHPRLNQMILDAFISEHYFYDMFRDHARNVFGSGWVWLVYDASTQGLGVLRTHGAVNPIVMNENWKPLMTMDVWEHSYYLDYQNLKMDYVDKFMAELMNWDFVAMNLDKALFDDFKAKHGLPRGDNEPPGYDDEL